MIAHNKKPELIILLLISILFLFCNEEPGLLTGASETGNVGISGQILDSNGLALENIRVRLFPHQYNSIKDSQSIMMAKTDASGFFLFSELMADTFNIIADDSAEAISGIQRNMYYEDSSSVTLEAISLGKNGSVEGRLFTSNYNSLGQVMMHVPGTPYQSISDSQGNFKFLTLPQDTFELETEFTLNQQVGNDTVTAVFKKQNIKCNNRTRPYRLFGFHCVTGGY